METSDHISGQGGMSPIQPGVVNGNNEGTPVRQNTPLFFSQSTIDAASPLQIQHGIENPSNPPLIPPQLDDGSKSDALNHLFQNIGSFSHEGLQDLLGTLSPQLADAVRHALETGLVSSEAFEDLSPKKETTDKDKEYLASLFTEEGGDVPKEFRAQVNYLVALVKLIAVLQSLRVLMNSIDSSAIKNQMDAEQENIKSQTNLVMERIHKQQELRAKIEKAEKAKGNWLTKSAEIYMIVVMAVTSAALTAATFGAATPLAVALMGIAITAIVISTALSIAETAGANVYGEMAVAFGMDEDKAWIMRLSVNVALMLAAIGSAASAGAASASRAGMTAAQSARVAGKASGAVAIEVVPMAVANSNVVFEVTYRIAVANGMSEEDAAILAAIINILMMIVMMLASMKVAPKNLDVSTWTKSDDLMDSVGKASKAADQVDASFNAGQKAQDFLDGLQNQLEKAAKDAKKAAEKGSPAIKEQADELLDRIDDLQKQIDELSKSSSEIAAGGSKTVGEQLDSLDSVDDIEASLNASQKAKKSLTDELKDKLTADNVQQWLADFSAITGAAASIMTGAAELQQGLLKMQIRDLQWDVDLLDVALELMRAAVPSYQRNREQLQKQILSDAEFVTNMHNILSQAFTEASQSSTDRWQALGA